MWRYFSTINRGSDFNKNSCLPSKEVVFLIMLAFTDKMGTSLTVYSVVGSAGVSNEARIQR